jgi:hypothetical protein
LTEGKGDLFLREFRLLHGNDPWFGLVQVTHCPKTLLYNDPVFWEGVTLVPVLLLTGWFTWDPAQRRWFASGRRSRGPRSGTRTARE